MKNGNLYQTLKSAKKDYSAAWAKQYKLEDAMKKELEEAKRHISEKYAPILKALENETSKRSQEFWHIGGIYHDYGSFFVRDIVDIFAFFLTYIEGEKYIPYRNWKNYEITEGSIIIKENINKQYDKIDYNVLDMLYKNGDLIRLDSGFSNVVCFYDIAGNPNYSFGQFNYLYEFVNRLIQYRIDNDKKNNITIEELYLFMCNFISTHPDLAQKNKAKREQMLIGQNEEDRLILECKKLERNLKK